MIKNLGYSWMLSGKEFNPDIVENLTGIAFKLKGKKGERFNNIRDRIRNEGSATLSATKGFTYWPLSPDDALLNAIETHYDLLRQCGVEEYIMYYTVGYRGQCNLEFTSEELQRLTRIGATLTFECIELDDEK